MNDPFRVGLLASPLIGDERCVNHNTFVLFSQAAF